MHQRSAMLVKYADLFPALTVHGHVVAGGIMTTTATHPECGAVIAIADIYPDLIVMSQRQIEDRDLLTHGKALGDLYVVDIYSQPNGG